MLLVIGLAACSTGSEFGREDCAEGRESGEGPGEHGGSGENGEGGGGGEVGGEESAAQYGLGETHEILSAGARLTLTPPLAIPSIAP